MSAATYPRRAALIVIAVTLGASIVTYAASLDVSSKSLTAFGTSTSLVTTTTSTPSTTATTAPTTVTCTIAASDDTFISSTQGAVNFNTTTPGTIRTDRRDSPATQILTVHGLIKFALVGATCSEGGTMPAGKTISGAKLSMMFTSGATTDSVSVCLAAAAWSETTTWNSADAALQSRTSCAGSSSNVSVVTHADNARTEWTVTSQASAIYSGSPTNNGWIIRNTTAGDIGSSGHAMNFASSESTTTAAHPLLILTYTP